MQFLNNILRFVSTLRPVWKKAIGACLVIFSCLLVLSFFITFPVTKPVNGMLLALLKPLAATGTVQNAYARIGHGITLKNLRISYGNAGTEITVTVPETGIDPQLGKLITGAIAFESATLFSPEAQIRSRKIKMHELLGLVGAPLLLKTGPAGVLGTLPGRISIRDGSVLFRAGNDSLFISGLSADQCLRNDFSSSIEFQKPLSSLLPPIHKISLTGNVIGSVLEIRPYVSGIFSGDANGILQLTGFDKIPGGAAVIGSVSAHSIDLKGLLDFYGSPFKNKISGALSGTCSLETVKLADPLAGTGKLEGTLLGCQIRKLPILGFLAISFEDERFKKIDFPTVSLKGTFRGEKLLVEDLYAQGDFISIRFAGTINISGYASGTLSILITESSFNSLKPSLPKLLFEKEQGRYILTIPFKGKWDNPQLNLQKSVGSNISNSSFGKFLREFFPGK